MDRVKIALLVYIALANAAGWSYVANSPSSLKQGIQGPGIKPDGKITVSSVMGQYMDQVDPATGKITPFIPFPKGSADDEAYRSDGTLVYTALLEGEVRSRSPNGVIKTIGTNNPVSPNGVAFDLNNVCFYSQYPAGTGFYRVDPSGNTEQVLIASLSSPMNGFDFGLDNKAYGPLPFEGTVVALDTTTGTTTVISSGYLDPESVRWSVDKKKLYVLDTGISSILEINTKTGASTKICTVPGLVYLDNFRVLGDSFIISDTVTNTVFQYNITTKKLRTVTTPNVFSLPMGISHNKGKLYIADFVSQKFYNTNNRKIETQARCGPQPPSTNQYDNQDVSFGIFNVYANSKFSAFSDNFDGRVQIRFTSDNKVFSQVSSGFAYGSYISDDNKYLVFNDFGTGIRVCSGPKLNNCNTLTQFPYTTLTGMAPGRKAGTVYVADYYEGKVFLVNYLTGKYNLVVSGLDKPEGISSRFGILGNDQLFVANTGGKTLVSVLITNNILGLPLPVSSTVTSVIATDLPIGLPGQAVFPEPFTFTGVAVADDGFVYITSDLESALIRVLALPIVI